MRDVKTLIARLNADLPISDEEIKVLQDHIDQGIKEQDRFIKNVFVVTLISFFGLIFFYSLKNGLFG